MSQRTLIATADGGGTIELAVFAVHVAGCPHWYVGKRHGPCTCGASRLLHDTRVKAVVDRVEKVAEGGTK